MGNKNIEIFHSPNELQTSVLKKFTTHFVAFWKGFDAPLATCVYYKTIFSQNLNGFENFYNHQF